MAKTECPNRIRVVLAEKEQTNKWLAEQMGVTEMTVSCWKTNKIQPSMAQFDEIARILKVDMQDLIEAEIDYGKPVISNNKENGNRKTNVMSIY